MGKNSDSAASESNALYCFNVKTRKRGHCWSPDRFKHFIEMALVITDSFQVIINS